MDQLDRVERLVSENESALRNALAKDFKTAWFEQNMEYYATLGSIADTKGATCPMDGARGVAAI